MPVLFIFIDGIGTGVNDVSNPLASGSLKTFSSFTGNIGLHNMCKPVTSENILYRSIDANLGIDGLPQSGTGQTSLFTGENASRIIGKHFGPYPHSKIKPLLQTNSLFHQAIAFGFRPFFLNAYPDIFFERSAKRNRWSCTTLMVQSAGVRLNRLQDVVEGTAITAEIVQSAWRNMLGLDVPEISPEDAADRMLSAAEKYDLVLYEYYLTDKAGHEKNYEMADKVLQIADRFMYKIISDLKPRDTLVITSDHGNLEDMDVKTHTRNAVPLMVKGNTEPFKNAESILDVTPAILNVLRMDR
jgi:2,3-bisphosphoglycerate-independent phosphoglycerate mutase